MEYLLLEQGKLVAKGEQKDILKYFGISPKKQRNLPQNNLYWKMLFQLAMKLKISVEETHFNMLKDYSVRYEILVPSGTELRGIEYKEKKSKIIKDGKEFEVWHVYTSSHELKTDEFALLLDGLIRECEIQGIPTINE